jgi:hypothetical protein
MEPEACGLSLRFSHFHSPQGTVAPGTSTSVGTIETRRQAELMTGDDAATAALLAACQVTSNKGVD